MAEGVGFSYRGADRPALAGVGFRLPAGKVLLVVGPSGSGKSTLARAMAGLVPGDFPGVWSGSLRVGDLETTSTDRAQLAAMVGILFQDPGSQLVMDRVADDVAFGLENRAWSLDAMRAAVPAALGDAGLAGFERRRGSRLSGGEQQRLALAGVMAARPGVLVLDEPTANLDPNGAMALFARLAVIKAAGSTTMVLVEHRADLAWPLADLVLALDGNGTPIDLGEPGVILARSARRLVDEGIWLPGDGASVGRGQVVAASPASIPGAGLSPRPESPGSGPGRIEVRDLRFAYEPATPILRGIALTIEPGERVALVGPNGSGKSTLLRLLAGLLRPSAGVVRLDGIDPSRLRPDRLAALAGFVFQDPELGFIEDTVSAEVAIGLGGSSAADLMARLGLPLDQFGDRSPYRLSGGEQRRLSVATALVRQPSILLLDEPTFGQDRRGWEAIVDIIAQLVAAGTTVIAATHDLAFASLVATRRIELAEGWIVADEPMDAGPSRDAGSSRAAGQSRAVDPPRSRGPRA